MTAPRLTSMQRDCLRRAAFAPLKRVGGRYIASGGEKFSAVTVRTLRAHGLLKYVYLGADFTEAGLRRAHQLGGPLP